MTPNKRHPALLRICRSGRPFGHVASNGTRRDSDADFGQEFIGNAFLSPHRVAYGHFGDQFLKVVGYTRSAARPGFPFPKQTKALAVPANQRVRFDDDQGIPPIEPPGESAKRETDRVGRSTRPNLAFDEKAELFA